MSRLQRAAKTSALRRITADKNIIIPTAELSDISEDEEVNELENNVAEYDIVDLEEEVEEIEADEPEEQYRWRKRTSDALHTAVDDQQNEEDYVSENFSPYNFAKLFFTDELLMHIVQQTNIYSVQETDKSINLSKEELEQYIGESKIFRLPTSLPMW